MMSDATAQFRFFVATRNAHKLQEIADILGPSVQLVGLRDLSGAPATVEDRPTFTGNAAKKASELAEWLASGGANHIPAGGFTKQFVLADDSGLEVDALNGAPGVHSARFAALDAEEGEQLPTNSTDESNNAKLLRLLERVPMSKRRARFRCVLAIVELAAGERLPATQVFDGSCEGRIDFERHGAGGFGYDPLFIPDDFDQSFAQLGADVKNRISHRSKALQKLRDWMETQ
jgi:XTP/dITP diphosphohydrolase